MSQQPASVQMVDLKGQYARIQDEIQQSFTEILQSGAFINGPYVHKFAGDLASYLNAVHVTPCGNGTDALQIALMALDLKPGDEVITSPFTFVSTAEVIALLGLKPVFVDALQDTFNIDHSAIERAVTDKTRCIIPVHLFGQTADMQPIMEIANKHGIFVVEDNAQAIGADYTFPDGKKQSAGTIGHIGCTSFYPTKNLGGYGDGGALCTNDEMLAAKIKKIANHGSAERYHHSEVGVNSRLDSLQAAVLHAKLKRLDEYNLARRQAADRYDALFADTDGVIIPYRATFSSHVFHQYTLTIKDGKRDAVAAHLKSKNIAHGIYYPISLHLQEAYQHYGYSEGDYPVSEQLCKEVLSLPMHTELTLELQQYIANEVNTAL